MNRVSLAAAASVLLLVAACDADAVPGAAPQQLDSLTTSSAGAPPRSPARSTHKLLDDDLSVTLSPPKSFTPTDAASPRAPRAVAFDLIIENGSGTVYRPAQLSIEATVDGRSAAQVVDSTQGYTGFVGASDEVRPGQSVRVTVAFAVPMERSRLRLTVQPDAAAGEPITVFEGTV